MERVVEKTVSFFADDSAVTDEVEGEVEEFFLEGDRN